MQANGFSIKKIKEDFEGNFSFSGFNTVVSVPSQISQNFNFSNNLKEK